MDNPLISICEFQPLADLSMNRLINPKHIIRKEGDIGLINKLVLKVLLKRFFIRWLGELS